MALWIPRCHAIEYPKNTPLIEALIELHKDMKRAEDKAVENIAISYGEQSAVTKKTVDFNDVKTTLNTKLNNAYSYVLLAAALSGTANSLYKLINAYSDFTSFMSAASPRRTRLITSWSCSRTPFRAMPTVSMRIMTSS